MKRIDYYNKIKVQPSSKVYLNIDYMKSGNYELQIINNKRVIKTIYFNKK